MRGVVFQMMIGRMNTYGGEGPSSVGVRNGFCLWREFCESTNSHYYSDGAVAMFDHHDVLDTLTWNESEQLGVALDHIEKVNTFLCSFGRSHRQEAFLEDAPWYPMVSECDGHIFTDYREGYHRTVDVYREPWMPSSCIAVSGDKGQVAQLFGKPVVLFDDKEANIDTLRRRSTLDCPLDGVVVRRGRKSRQSVRSGYQVANDIDSWLGTVEALVSEFSLPRIVMHHPPSPADGGGGTARTSCIGGLYGAE